MSMGTTYWAWSYPKLKPIQKIVLMAMAEACSGLDSFSTASPDWILKEIRCSDCTLDTIKSALSDLEKIGAIKNVSGDAEVIEYFIDCGIEREFFWELLGYVPTHNQFKRRGK